MEVINSDQQLSQQQKKHLPASIEKSFSAKEIETVKQGRAFPIKDDPDANQKLIAMLSLVSESFGSRKEINSRVLQTCVRIVRHQFSKIGIQEIYQAFEWNSAGIIEGGKMWGGEFNADVLGQTLNAYMKKRRLIVNEIINQQEEQKRIEQKQIQIEKKRENYNRLVSNFEDIYKSQSFESWHKIPAYYYDIAKQKGLIKFAKGEAVSIYQRAKQIAKQELRQQIDNCSNIHLVGSLIKKLELGECEERAKVIARKISVFEKVK